MEASYYKEEDGVRKIDYDKYEREVKNNPGMLQFWQLVFEGGIDYDTVDSFDYDEFLRAYSGMKVINKMKEKKAKEEINKSKK
ncbi:hypothetical protein [Natroniella sp. ANB-PHB2]|uniref:hypothetical protein n=1 Tax=Natroniella sp. ANB-PHB2 TaxID=3384444 RepID=UPI0038D41F6E